jgi:hypothetical protein
LYKHLANHRARNGATEGDDQIEAAGRASNARKGEGAHRDQGRNGPTNPTIHWTQYSLQGLYR